MSPRLLLLLPLLGLTAAFAADPAAKSPVEDRLRANLRDLTVQLRTAQNDLAAAQAAQTTAQDEKRAVTEKFDAFKTQVAAQRAETDRTLAALQAQLAERKAAQEKLTATLAAARAENERLTAALQQSEGTVRELTVARDLLDRRAADLQAKNLALFLTANEILRRYENYSLGKALLAKEPFVGTTRAKLETLVQDYRDKLSDQRARQ